MKIIIVFFALVLMFSCSESFDGKNGLKIVNFPNSDDTCQIIQYKDGKKNGYLKEFYKNGNLKTEQHFLDDKNVDTAKFYHSNGKISAVQIYDKGYKAGCWERYNEQGKMYSKICFQNGVYHGTALTYSYKSLHLIEKFNFDNGAKEGSQETFYNSGKPKSISYYHNDQPILGTKEWSESGKEINNDFSIHYQEDNKVNLENKLFYYVTLENPHNEDRVFRISEKDTGIAVTQIQRLEKVGDKFILQFNVYPGGFVMEKVKIAAYRKTSFGNVFIKTISFNASVNNY